MEMLEDGFLEDIPQKEEVFNYTPPDEQAASQFLQECNALKKTVRIIGGNTKSDLGDLYAPTAATLSTLHMADLIEYHPEDLTITVGAGMTFARLQEILAQQGQFLPLDVPDLSGQTVGGVLATNRSGPRRLLYGTARDWLIGCRYVLADGTIAHSGGKVVKNVAGYDLHKLFIGAFGTLGLLTEVTFKVAPLPATALSVIAPFDSLEAALIAARRCVRSNLQPAFLEIRQSGMLPLLCFGAEGVEVAVAAQMEQLSEICRAAGTGTTEIITPAGTEKVLHRFAMFPSGSTVVRIGTTLTKLPALLVQLEQLATDLQVEYDFQIRAGNGLLYAGFSLDESHYEAFAAKIQSWRLQLARQGSYLVIEKTTPALKKLVNVWGDFGSALPPMQNLKNKLDPHHLLNPGILDLF